MPSNQHLVVLVSKPHSANVIALSSLRELKENYPEQVHLLVGEQNDPTDLRRCSLKKARALLALPSTRACTKPEQAQQDANSLVTYLMVRKFSRAFPIIELSKYRGG